MGCKHGNWDGPCGECDVEAGKVGDQRDEEVESLKGRLALAEDSFKVTNEKAEAALASPDRRAEPNPESRFSEVHQEWARRGPGTSCPCDGCQGTAPPVTGAEIAALKAEVAALRRALAAGPARLRSVADDYDGAADIYHCAAGIVERAQAAAMKEKL